MVLAEEIPGWETAIFGRLGTTFRRQTPTIQMGWALGRHVVDASVSDYPPRLLAGIVFELAAVLPELSGFGRVPSKRK